MVVSEPAVTLTFGPVLHFRGARAGAWHLCALAGVAGEEPPPPLEAADRRIAPQRLAARDGVGLWRYDFALPQAGTPSTHDYRIGTRAWRVHLPAAGGDLRIAYSACNGSEKANAWDRSQERNERWLHLARRHADAPFHLLLQGGDQLYADPLWEEVPALAAWTRRWWWQRRRAGFTLAMADAVAAHYVRHYLRLWRQPELSPVLAAIPSLMMWDDHDIFDGWGSWAPKWQACPVFQGVFRAAREAFALFQLAALPDALPEGFCDRRGGHFGYAFRIGDVGLLVPDLRSERTYARVMGEAGWGAFDGALEVMAGCRDVLLVSSMPLVTPELSALERFFKLMPGHQTWQDDLVDQWPSLAHRKEWVALLRRLADFSARTGARITSLSGEIHLGALGVIERGPTRIWQLTSSGIAHPPPPAWAVAAMEWIGRGTSRPAPDLAVRLLPLPGLGRRFLRTRNWLELELPAGDAVRATWHGETATSRLEIG